MRCFRARLRIGRVQMEEIDAVLADMDTSGHQTLNLALMKSVPLKNSMRCDCSMEIDPIGQDCEMQE